MTHWATNYIGKPWKMAADGPDAFDCWGLLVDVQRQLFNRKIEVIPVEEGNLMQLAKTIRDHPMRKNWNPTNAPCEGDVALLRQSRHPIHVGVWLDIDGGGILHCVKGSGVVFQTESSLHLSGWKIEGYYCYAGDS